MEKINILQKILLITIYAIIILSIVLSFMATKNIGKEGFDRCVEKLCTKSPHRCEKFIYNNNCCVGSGGKTGQGPDGFTCVYP